MSTSNPHRLPCDLRPSAYQVHLRLSPTRPDFSGNVDIQARSAQPLDHFELNARGLELSNPTVRAGGREIPAQVVVHPETERIELQLAEAVPAGALQIHADFQGQMHNDMHGLYLAQDGDEKAIVSQCESADARAIFPCFDEPCFKASLQWKVTTDEGLTVVTNGPVVSETRQDGQVTTEFAPVQGIPSYLAAVTVGQFEASPTRLIQGIPSRFLVAPGCEAQTTFAQGVTADVVPWYEGYFDQKYPFQKLDQVAVPGFDAGAMENAGAIFYRRSELQLDEKSASLGTRQRVSEVVAHEIAHQWFGNLVTMQWWDSLWLNEAFATWVSHKAVDATRPDLRMWDYFQDGRIRALKADALDKTHAIYTQVDTPRQADENFDLITYEKGCSVIRMVERYLGEDPFRRGLQGYMREHKGGNATSSDLWTALEKASGVPTEALIRSWIEQPGYPVVRFENDQVAQHRCNHAESDQTWLVPLVVKYEDSEGIKEYRTLFGDRTGKLDLPAHGEVKWMYPNADANGFYRCQLDDRQFSALLEKGLGQLSSAEKVSLLDDQLELFRAGEGGLERWLSAVQALGQDPDPYVVAALTRQVEAMTRVVGPDQEEAFHGFVQGLLEPQWAELAASQSDNPELRQRRSAVASCLAGAGHAGVAETLAGLAGEALRNPDGVESGMASAALQAAAHEGGPEQVDRYLETFARLRAGSAAPEAQLRYLKALSAFAQPAAVDQVLASLASVPQESLGQTLQGMLANRDAQAATWEYVQANWSRLAEEVGPMGVDNLVRATGNLPVERMGEVRAFFAAHAVPDMTRPVLQAVEESEKTAATAARAREGLERFLGGATGR